MPAIRASYTVLERGLTDDVQASLRYFGRPGRREARIAANVAKLPELLARKD
jgi:hypothetical protein